jgi:Grap2 and cyclin-D-interacting
MNEISTLNLGPSSKPPILFEDFDSTSTNLSLSNSMTSQPPSSSESVGQALKALRSQSTELLQTCKALLHSPPTQTTPSSSNPETLQDIAKLATLIHSHTVRTALTCGTTASNPTVSHNCLKSLHEPILPLMAAYQVVRAEEYPTFFVKSVGHSLERVLDTMGVFVGEIVEIASGGTSVESAERLRYSGMMLECCDDLKGIVDKGVEGILKKKLNETISMLKDATEEVSEVAQQETKDEQEDERLVNDEDDQEEVLEDDEVEYSATEKEFAKRVQKQLHLLSLLYKAISKRRLSLTGPYDSSLRTKLESIHDLLSLLASLVDELVSGIVAQEDAMKLELLDVELLQEARKLGESVRLPLSGNGDGKEEWFDAWLQRMV